jgi:hypothetical protein
MLETDDATKSSTQQEEKGMLLLIAGKDILSYSGDRGGPKEKTATRSCQHFPLFR